MCHGAAVAAFPAARLGDAFERHIHGYAYGNRDSKAHIAIVPDIYGCNPLYQGLSLYYAERGARVSLINPFHGLGELPEMTREHAFPRRNKIADQIFVDQVETFAKAEGVTAIIGFCLGGLYIFELARRGLECALVGLYGFPQGMANSEALPVPFDYLPTVTQPFTMLMGRLDEPVTKEVMDQLSAIAPKCPAMDLVMYPHAGHGFLADLSSTDAGKRAVAEDALARMDKAALAA